MLFESVRRQLTLLGDPARDGIYEVDPEGRTTLVTPEVAAMTGHTADELVGRPFHEVVHHSHADGSRYPRDECPIFNACRSGTVRHAVETFLRKDGSPFSVSYTTTPMIHAGEVVGGIVVVRDLDRVVRDLEIESLGGREGRSAAAANEMPTGESRAWLNIMQSVRRVAGVDSTVLLQGESGTGKELVARALHDLGPRRHRPMVKVNCGAIPAGLFESELFGHERGAFTGAGALRAGRFEQAADGTLLLDEIGEMTLDGQVKLLRVLQEREFERVGGSKPIPCRARIVAATNQNLAALVRQGRFRADLYYRLNVFPIDLPPLRERREDIPILIQHFVERMESRLGRSLRGFCPDAETLLLAHDWPGNVRELENVVERAALLADDTGWLAPPSLGASVTSLERATRRGRPAGVPLDRGALVASLEAAGWKVTGSHGAAAALGIHPNTLRNKMRELGIMRPVSR